MKFYNFILIVIILNDFNGYFHTYTKQWKKDKKQITLDIYKIYSHFEDFNNSYLMNEKL